MKKPGILSFQPFAAAELEHSDSLEGLLRHPLILSAEYDVDYGTPRRGNFVWAQTDGTVAPIVAAEIVTRNAASDYDVVFYADVAVGDAVTVYDADGTTKDTATVASVETIVTSERGLTSGANRVTLTYTVGEVTTPTLIVYTAAVGKAPAGIVYESSLDKDFSLAVDVDGARLEKVAGAQTEWISAVTGVTVALNLLFFTIK